MLALKKKREAATAAKAAAAGRREEPETIAAKGDVSDPRVVSLFGIGGEKKSKNGEGKTAKKRTPGEIRIQKDIAELDGGDVANISFPNPNDLTTFAVSVSPDTGYWTGATYHFTLTIPPHYPHSPPKVECQTKIYHPNIDLQGKVCLNILRQDWKPVLDINAVIYGLLYLFYEPNPDDPLNKEAAELFRKDASGFGRLVTRTLRGGMLDGVQFERFV
ncbi:Probable NEDD8-conjugating enzyme Ubc12-like [Seminavis robusta]|uniref:Probable NEDD8-conjugating enzyme Ubc12-like n=1 Tax=Seminavis robusta TaxID=568900 RepID=A0A9N8E1S3_9STRA|nr:Probable NEDD8-conjugating enzyme Ubc12-like [Seminavis robusta]|eukprot:Sro530_g161250.1 Probable NEDD8-conjugating enzyme Ubc12-like (218) ;mRNA; f:40122-41038